MIKLKQFILLEEDSLKKDKLIIAKKKINKLKLKKNDKIEIVHFIGGG